MKQLAALRLAVMGVVLLDLDVWRAPSFAALPPHARVSPWGFGWAAPLLPQSEAQARVLLAAVLVAAALGLVGLFARAAAAASAVLLALLLALPQQTGSVLHAHHLVWLCAALALSPCADVWSLDARRRRGARPERDYRWPLAVARLLLACVFFFPGLAKLRAQGLGWAFSDTVLHQMQFKWLERGALPALRLDHRPVLLHGGALLAHLLELGAPALVLFRWPALAWAFAALGFHLATWLFMDINFSSLWPCYVVFLPFAPSPSGIRPTVRALAGGAALLAAVAAAGLARLEHAWPFACYPTFAHDPGGWAPVLEIDAVGPGGAVRPVELVVRDDAAWGEMWSVLRAPSPERLRAFLLRHAPGEEATRVRFYRARVSIDPDAPRTRLRGALIAELDQTAVPPRPAHPSNGD